MENTPKNNSSQNELDLGLNQSDSATPRKEMKVDPSILNKVTTLFGKKESVQPTQFAVRKEPTFGSLEPTQASATIPGSVSPTPTQNIVSHSQQNTVNYSSPVFKAEQTVKNSTQTAQTAVHSNEEIQTMAESTTTPIQSSVEPVSFTENINVEPVQVEESVVATNAPEPAPAETEREPVIAAQDRPNRKNPENWAIMQKLPTKHRRLFIAIAGAVAVLLALLWLKPSNDTVEEIQANNGASMPVEFQSLDPNKPMENAEATNVAPAENTMAEPSNATAAEAGSDIAPLTNTQQTPATNLMPAEPQATAPASVVDQATAPAATTPAAMPAPVAQAKSDNARLAEQANAEQARKAEQARLAAEKARKAEQDKLVAEKTRKAEQDKLAAEKARKAELDKLAAEKARKAEQAKAAADKAKQAAKGAPVVEAKPAGSSAATTAKATSAAPAASSTANATSKTLTVPASTSLFQVFRSNGLDIRDANAMTKAAGAGNVLSSFKANDKVQVSVSQGRVSTMRLSNGATFTRQADGSYKYSK
ncbi:hypothetical protein A4G18_06030 [Pasteurellaceae bacterium Pebbles2]|nr:hypothetical protein [Pasteurellaceae bacterium Pebbles2]